MKDVLKIFLLFFLLKIEIFSQDSSLFKKTFPLESKLLHKTPNPFFQGRPYFLELFSDIPLDSLESINFYFKTDKSKNYRDTSEKYCPPYTVMRFIYRFIIIFCSVVFLTESIDIMNAIIDCYSDSYSSNCYRHHVEGKIH